MKMKGAITAAALLGLAVIVPVKGGATASAVEIAAIPWDASNIATLRSANVADVERLVCGSEPPCWANVDQFEWADLEGNGKYSLVCVWDARGKVQTISIFQRAASGKIAQQSIDLEGYGHEENLADAIRDLNGDGKKELIINSGFGEGRDMAETPLTQWPLVYRLQRGQYVEASREFPGFYDKEVLPLLEKQIVELQEKLGSEAEAKASGEAVMKEYHWIGPDIESHTTPAQAQAVKDSEHLAVLQRLRNHILLVLGRRLTAKEEKEPREWLKSSNGTLAWYAEDAFEDMGDHATDVQEAKQALARMASGSSNASAEEPKISPAPAPPPVAPGN
jgi:hypothetical protein